MVLINTAAWVGCFAGLTVILGVVYSAMQLSKLCYEKKRFCYCILVQLESSDVRVLYISFALSSLHGVYPPRPLMILAEEGTKAILTYIKNNNH